MLEQLRTATWHRHEALEKLAFVKALQDGTLPLQSYIGQLRGFAVIFSTIEQTLARSDAPVIRGVRTHMKSRFAMLCADLAVFAPQQVPDILPAVRHALDIAGKIRSDAAVAESKLLGYLYVLEGTTKGNQVHLPDIVKCFNIIDDQGVSFYIGYGADTDAHWESFRHIMNSAGAEVLQDAIQGATEMFDALELFHKALYPIAAKDQGFAAISLNPEAGDHPVPQDPEILQAAVRAGRRCWDEFSYYELRYGERGRRFTDSDAAWLAALAGQPAAVVTDQVLWLGRVLSARGMPFLLMERQLELLVEELEALGKGITTSGLTATLNGLKQQRCRLVSQERFDEICRAVEKIIPPLRLREFPDLPVLLAAAQLDLLAGIPECMTSFTAWFKDAALITEDDFAKMRQLITDMFCPDCNSGDSATFGSGH